MGKSLNFMKRSWNLKLKISKLKNHWKSLNFGSVTHGKIIKSPRSNLLFLVHFRCRHRDHLGTKVRCMDLPDSDLSDFSCQRAVDSSSYVSGNKHPGVLFYIFDWCNWNDRIQSMVSKTLFFVSEGHHIDICFSFQLFHIHALNA